MDITSQTPLFETAPRTARKAADSAPVAVRKSSRTHNADETGTASFPSLMVEKQAPRETTGNTIGTEDKAKSDRKTPLATRATGQTTTENNGNVNGGDPTKTTDAEAGTAAAKIADGLGVALAADTVASQGATPGAVAQGLGVQELQQTATTSVLVGPEAAAQTKMTTEIPTAIQSEMPSAIQSATPQSATPNAMPSATPTAAPVAEQAKAAAPVMTAATEAPSTSAPATADQPTKAQTVPVPASAASAAQLQSTVKGHDTYTQAPIVSESQLIADSLRSPDKSPTVQNQAAETESAVTADAANVVATETSPDAGTQQQSDAPLPSPAAPNMDTVIADAPATETPVATNTAAEAELALLEAALADASAGLTDTAIESRLSGTTVSSASTSGITDHATARSIRQQVSQQVSSRLADIVGSEKITIKLNPESLGQVELNFESKDDRLNVVIIASSQEAEGALRESLKDLTDRIVERSARFSHVDVRVEIKDGADTRQDSKQDQKQDSRQDQRRDQSGRNEEDGQSGQNAHGHHARQAQQAWESAMSWQLAEDAANEEG